MGLAYILVAILSAAVAVFALQNHEAIPVRFIVWTLPSVSLAGAILTALAAGLVLAATPLSISLWRSRSRARKLEARVAMLETALAARDQALLAQRVPPVPNPRSA